MNPLQSIPAAVRTRLYWAGYVLGLVAQLLTIVWASVAAASPDVAMPLWLVVTSAVLAFLTTQLNLLAGSNVTDPQTVTTTAPPESTVTTEVDVHKDGAGTYLDAMKAAGGTSSSGDPSSLS